VEFGWHIYRNDIGNVAKTWHVFEGKPDKNRIIQLPCNVEYIESVSSNRVAYNSLGRITISNDDVEPYYTYSPYILDLVDRDRYKTKSLQQSITRPTGQFISYDLLPQNRIQLRHDNLTDIPIYVLYRGIILDHDGLPMLYLKESMAIASRLAFILTQRDVFKKIPGAAQILEYIKRESSRLTLACKSPEHMTQQDIDKLLDRQTSFDRKVYGRTYKISR
jgi:hypothetical protein